jgi:hypothetical protein
MELCANAVEKQRNKTPCSSLIMSGAIDDHEVNNKWQVYYTADRVFYLPIG